MSKIDRKKILSEILGEEKVNAVENLDKNREIIGNYIKSLVELVREDTKDVPGLKVLEELYENKESHSPNYLAIVVNENDDDSHRAMMNYALEPIVMEALYVEDEDGTIDIRSSKMDYSVMSDEKKLREKCDKIIAKHFLIVTTMVGAMSKGDREQLMKVADNMVKKYKQAKIEYRDSKTDRLLNRREVGDDNFIKFIKGLM